MDKWQSVANKSTATQSMHMQPSIDSHTILEMKLMRATQKNAIVFLNEWGTANE